MATHHTHLGNHLDTHRDERVRDPELSGMLLLVGLILALLVLVILAT